MPGDTLRKRLQRDRCVGCVRWLLRARLEPRNHCFGTRIGLRASERALRLQHDCGDHRSQPAAQLCVPHARVRVGQLAPHVAQMLARRPHERL